MGSAAGRGRDLDPHCLRLDRGSRRVVVHALVAVALRLVAGRHALRAHAASVGLARLACLRAVGRLLPACLGPRNARPDRMLVGALCARRVVGQVEVATPGTLPAFDAAQVFVHRLEERDEGGLVERLPAVAHPAVTRLVLRAGALQAEAFGAGRRVQVGFSSNCGGARPTTEASRPEPSHPPYISSSSCPSPAGASSSGAAP